MFSPMNTNASILVALPLLAITLLRFNFWNIMLDSVKPPYIIAKIRVARTEFVYLPFNVFNASERISFRIIIVLGFGGFAYGIRMPITVMSSTCM